MRACASHRGRDRCRDRYRTFMVIDQSSLVIGNGNCKSVVVSGAKRNGCRGRHRRGFLDPEKPITITTTERPHLPPAVILRLDRRIHYTLPHGERWPSESESHTFSSSPEQARAFRRECRNAIPIQRVTAGVSGAILEFDLIQDQASGIRQPVRPNPLIPLRISRGLALAPSPFPW